MLNTLNNRISRTLVTLILPLGMSLGLTNNIYATSDWAPHTAPQNQGARAYSTTIGETTITVRLGSVHGNTVNGVVLIADTACSFAAQASGQTLSGTLVYGGNVCHFTARIQGSVMYFDGFGTHLVLDQIA